MMIVHMEHILGRWRSLSRHRWAPAGQHGDARRPRDAGISVVEVAITFPALLLMILLVFQVGLWWHARHLAEAAAREGARAARSLGGSAADGESRAEDYLGRLGPRMLIRRDVSASRDATTATVRVHVTVISVVPGLRLDADEHSSGPVERYVPPP
jgi:Flp pilus assembly protein TadG